MDAETEQAMLDIVAALIPMSDASDIAFLEQIATRIAAGDDLTIDDLIELERVEQEAVARFASRFHATPWPSHEEADEAARLGLAPPLPTIAEAVKTIGPRRYNRSLIAGPSRQPYRSGFRKGRT